MPQLSSVLFPGKTESQCMEPFLNKSDSILIKLLMPALLNQGKFHEEPFVQTSKPAPPGRGEYRAFHPITAVSGAVQLPKHCLIP